MNALLARKIKCFLRRRGASRTAVYMPQAHTQKTERKERPYSALPLLRCHEFQVGGVCFHATSPGVLRRRKQAASIG